MNNRYISALKAVACNLALAQKRGDDIGPYGRLAEEAANTALTPRRRRSSYTVACHQLSDRGYGVCARSWKQALEDAITVHNLPGFAVFRGYPGEQREPGWHRIILGALVLDIVTRRRK